MSSAGSGLLDFGRHCAPWGDCGGSPGGTRRTTCPRPLHPAAAVDSAASWGVGGHLGAIIAGSLFVPLSKGPSPGLCHGIRSQGP